MTALKDLLADPDQTIAFLVELDYRNPSTDVEDTVRITDNNIALDDLPAGYVWGLLGPPKEGQDSSVGPGVRAVSAEADDLGGILNLTVEPITLLNVPPEPGGAGPLDWLRNVTLSGRPVRVLAGSPTEDPATDWEDVASGIVQDEPEVDRDRAVVVIRVKSALGILDQDLDVGTYVGEPNALRMLTSTGIADAANNAAHHLTSFHLAGRFWHPGVGATNRFLSRRILGGIQNWNVRLLATSGLFNARYSHSAGTIVDLTSASRFDDGKVHFWDFDFRSGRQYVMVDGVIVAQGTATHTPDLPTAGVSQGATFQTGAILDHRILNHSIDPNEARSWMAVRASGTEQGLVGLWRGDDNGGNTLTDYSPTGAHATIAGVENTAFEWVSSDLGTPELAGTSMLAMVGAIWTFVCDLVDAVRERWRFNDRALPSIGTVSVRDQGELLTGGGTDYDVENDSIIALVGEAGEPLTVSHVPIPLYDYDIDRLLAELVVTRGPLATAEIDTIRLGSLYAVAPGLMTRRAPIKGLVEDKVLRGVLGCASVRRDAVLAFDSIVPPTAPSPADGPCVEISASGQAGDGMISWETGTPFITQRNFTLCAWLKTHRWGPNDSPFGDIPVLRLSDGSDHELRFNIDVDSGVPFVEIEWHFQGSLVAIGNEQRRQAGIGELLGDALGRWAFLVVVHNEATAQTLFYLGLEGEATLRLLGTADNLIWDAHFPDGISLPGFEDLHIGGDVGNPLGGIYRHFRGSVWNPQAWDAALTLAEIEDIFTDDVASTTNRTFYATVAGLSVDALEDQESSTAGVAVGDVVQRPDLEVDLRQTPRPWDEKRLRPAKSIRVHYQENPNPLGPADIASAVPDDERAAQKRDHLALPVVLPEVADDYLDARDIIIKSPWYTISGAQAALRLARYRFGEGRFFAMLGAAAGAPLRQGITLEVGDEVRVYGHQELEDGPVYRVASNRAKLTDLDAELGLWR